MYSVLNFLHCYIYLSGFVSGDVVTQTPLQMTVTEGLDVALTCSTDVAANSMAWYIQEPGENPSYLFQSFSQPEDLDNDRKGIVLTFKSGYRCRSQSEHCRDIIIIIILYSANSFRSALQ
uniref:Immunoglobulin V-set domain-containing protein n=1 Tax=Leptobrachium leishanense TaxID=445787 RepID=A0A8C5M6U8_9ANUR